MGGVLGGLVSHVITKGGVFTCGCDVGVYEAYVSMYICVICWLGWCICVHSAVIYVYLSYMWLLSWDLKLERLDIDALD